MMIIFSILVLTIAYLTGSICSAVIVCRLFSLPDPRLEGSKNPGATNVMRLAGKKFAVMVLIADMLKGLLPVLLASSLGASNMLLGFTCLAAMLGHIYTLFFNFKGGKGVATTLGALLGFHLGLGFIVLVTWLLVARISRYSSLASIIAIALSPFFSLFTIGHVNSFLPLMAIAIIVLYQHRHNVTRLINGEEPKVRFNGST